MKPENLTIKQVAKALKAPPEKWHGNCYAVATAAQKLLKTGTVAYGHYLGPVSKKGYWGSRKGHPFIQHGWVVLDDGRVLDPTRWSFMDGKPSIWIGPADEYDRGGQQWRSKLRRPPPKDDDHPKRIKLDLSPQAANHLNGLLLRDRPSDEINFPQAGWLASGPVSDLGPYVKEFFEMLVKKGLGAFIPLDTREMVLGK